MKTEADGVCGVVLDRADQPPDAGAGEGCIGRDSDGRAGAVEVRELSRLFCVQGGCLG